MPKGKMSKRKNIERKTECGPLSIFFLFDSFSLRHLQQSQNFPLPGKKYINFDHLGSYFGHKQSVKNPDCISIISGSIGLKVEKLRHKYMLPLQRKIFKHKYVSWRFILHSRAQYCLSLVKISCQTVLVYMSREAVFEKPPA